MKIIINILAIIGALVLTFVGVCAIKNSDMIEKVSKLDEKAIPAYMKMFKNVLEYGDPARAMMKEFKVDSEVSNEDVIESIKVLAEEYNMRITGDIKMYTKDDAKPEEIKHARIISLCSLAIAKTFLNNTRYYGGFMPCRIMLVEYGNGDRFLVTMDMTLAIYGGYPLPDEMKRLGLGVKQAMEEIPQRAVKGDF